MNFAARNAEIVAAMERGERTVDLAVRYGISRQRVEQVYRRDRHNARCAVSDALATGKIVRPRNCQGCNRRRRIIEAHHDDYSRPLDVRWLCRPCHRRADMKIQAPIIAARKAARAVAHARLVAERRGARVARAKAVKRERWVAVLRALRGFVGRNHRAPAYYELASLVLGRTVKPNAALSTLGTYLLYGRRVQGRPYWRRVQALYRLAGIQPRARGWHGHTEHRQAA